MIVGDPYYFAIQYDPVVSWNILGDTWKNGLFSIYVDGQRIFHRVNATELVTTIGFYRNFPVDEIIVNNLNIDAACLYRNAQEYFLGDADRIVDGLFDLTCTAMEDVGCYLYFMKTLSGDRLVWSVDDGVIVNEITLEAGTVKKLVEELKTCKL